MANNVAIVIPAYNENINRYEEIAIDRCYRVFAEKHDIYLLTPNDLEFRDLQAKYPLLKRKSLDESNFKSIAAYNRLMLSSQFYKCFETYEYMLIYQLDAFVFHDDLDRWCEQGYDYVGAPWNVSRTPFVWLSLLTARILRFLRIYETKYYLYGFVGNGGVSLRKVDRFIKMAEVMEQDPKLPVRIRVGAMNEDVVWSLYVPDHKGEIKMPHYKVAEQFSIDVLPDNKQAADTTMFSHGWNKDETLVDFWRHNVEQCGYKL